MNTLKTLEFQQQKCLMTGKMLPTLPDFSGAFLRRLSKVLLLTSVSTVLTASPGWAVVLTPTNVSVSTPSGSNNGTLNGSSSQPYTDDILLNTVTFGSVTFQSTGNAFRTVQRAAVITNRSGVNAEFGDNDTGSDLNSNPFVTAGILNEGASLPSTTRESTVQAVQDAAVQAAFNSLSLSQGTDGEKGNYSYDLIFQQGTVDNSSAADAVPELVFFERGVNSNFQVQVITGGTQASPTLSNPVTVLASNMFPTGIYIDTIEIDGGQQLGAIGIDLNDFGLGANVPIFGARVTSINNTGADIYGQFVTVVDQDQQIRDTPSELVPFELSPAMGILALGAWGVIAQLKNKVQKWKFSRRGELN